MTAAPRTQIPEPTHTVGDLVHGFKITAVTPIEDIKALAYEAEHEETGARVLHVHCNDEENMFSVGFRTPPPDSTGVAHILEHSVLAGSERYPVKEAFNELRKRTMSTFLNAMTWPDRTIYPVSSAVKADYFNLASVYADLVFHPLISEKTFMQEGHHLEFEEPEDADTALKITGVVYNEMKGVYSSPENLVRRMSQTALLPDTPYGVDSGGDPDVIPELTYEDFVGFHRKFYSPTNARFLLYGDVSIDDNLEFLEGVLEPFDRVDVDSTIERQERWGEPRQVELTYPVGSDDALDGKTFVLLNWLVDATANVEEALLMEVVVDAIYGSAAGRLRRALIDAGIGSDVFPRGGFEAELQETAVSFGLRGADPEDADAVEALILETLEAIVEEGVDIELIEASFHQIEFSGKEIVPPFPIMVLVRACPPWYFEGDPKDGLRFSTLVERVRARWADNPSLFEELIQSHLIDNPHRLRVVAAPSNTMAKEQEDALADKLAAQKAEMDEVELERIKQSALELTADQNTPDTPEALATLPRLDLDDLPRRVRTVPSRKIEIAGVDVYEHPVFSNDVGYLSFAFDTRDVTNDLAPLLPMAGRATTQMGAAGLDYQQMTKRIATHTGGVGASPMTGRHLRSGERYEYLNLSTKILSRNAEPLFEILGDLMLRPDTSDLKRLRDLVLEAATRSEASVVPSGHSYAYTRAAAGLGLDHYRSEQWGGISQIHYLKNLVAGGDDAIESLAAEVANFQRLVFDKSRLFVHVAGDPEVLDAIRPHLETFLEGLPAHGALTPAKNPLPALPQATGVVIPAQVNYVGQVLEVPGYLDPAAPALELLTQLLSGEYLYKKIRVQGGAYGGFGFYRKASGILPLLSYRDPNLLKTLQVYQGLVDYIHSDAIDDDAIDGVRTGAIGDFDQLLSPAQQLAVARSRRLLGLTDDDRMAFRDGLFHTTAEDVRKLAVPELEAALANAPIAALASKEKLEEASEAIEGLEVVPLVP